MDWGLEEASAQWGPMNQSSLVIVANASLESGILVASVSLPFSQCWINPNKHLLLGPLPPRDVALSLCFRGPYSGPSPTWDFGFPDPTAPSRVPGPLPQIHWQGAHPEAKDGQGTAVLQGAGRQSLDSYLEL